MKREIQYGSETFQIQVEKDSHIITVTFKGKPYTFLSKQTAQGWVLHAKNQVFATSMIQKKNDLHVVEVNGSEVEVHYKDPYQLASAVGAAGAQGDIQAVMPGRVVKLMVEVGQEVSQNQPVLVLEAMKMENEIKAPCDGKVKRVLVKENDSVESGAMLIHIEPAT